MCQIEQYPYRKAVNFDTNQLNNADLYAIVLYTIVQYTRV